MLAKKADLSDLQRVIAALENKIDLTSFESLVRAVESKADRHELNQIPSSFRGGSVDRHQSSTGTDIEKTVQ